MSEINLAHLLPSSIHWVMMQDGIKMVEDVIQHTYAWNHRKKQFTPRQITIAEKDR